ncbi:hypothetical protein [Microcoleus sp. herbarium12]|uniref:hypothetical protein n=1 Tax=Microcoleus sp. herbarium12 TaxID=3055437 RepID=UPI002FD29FA6
MLGKTCCLGNTFSISLVAPQQVMDCLSQHPDCEFGIAVNAGQNCGCIIANSLQTAIAPSNILGASHFCEGSSISADNLLVRIRYLLPKC